MVAEVVEERADVAALLAEVIVEVRVVLRVARGVRGARLLPGRALARPTELPLAPPLGDALGVRAIGPGLTDSLVSLVTLVL